MKKILSLILSVALLLGCASSTAFATDTKTGTTKIKADIADLSYQIVIPNDMEMTAAGVKLIGTPTVEDVTSPKSKSFIYYTAVTTPFTLSDGTKTIPTTYYSDENGTTVFPSTRVKVFENGNIIDPLPAIYIGVTGDDWDAATEGTYTASVTFNFDDDVKKTAKSIIDTVPGGFPTTEDAGWTTERGSKIRMAKPQNIDALAIMQGGVELFLLTDDFEPTDTGYRYVKEDNQYMFAYIDLIMTNGVLTEIWCVDEMKDEEMPEPMRKHIEIYKPQN